MSVQMADLIFELPLQKNCPACQETAMEYYFFALSPRGSGGRLIGYRKDAHACGAALTVDPNILERGA